MFKNNILYFSKHADAIRHTWLEIAKKFYREKPEIDLHIHMISTIVSAEEVYTGKTGAYAHKDEMWFWISQDELAIERFKRFLNSFQSSPAWKTKPLEVEFLGDNAKELSLIFQESFFEIPHKISKKLSWKIAASSSAFSPKNSTSRGLSFNPGEAWKALRKRLKDAGL